jgi:hypothetical protein
MRNEVFEVAGFDDGAAKSCAGIGCSMEKRSSDPARLGVSASGRIRTSVKRLVIPEAFRTAQVARAEEILNVH